MKGLVQVWKLFDAEPVWSEKVDELQVSVNNYTEAFIFISC